MEKFNFIFIFPLLSSIIIALLTFIMLTTCTESPPTELTASNKSEILKKEVLLKGYISKDNYAGCNFLKIGTDQRYGWNNMFDRYGHIKFRQTWINQFKDRNEFINLFDRAKSLNLDIVWNYALDDNSDETSTTNIWSFCSAVLYKGYLRRFSHQVRYEYKCYNETTPCDCPPMNIDPDSWYLNKVIHYYVITREDIPSD